LFHASGEVNRKTLRFVIYRHVIMYRPKKHLARMQTHSNLERRTALHPRLHFQGSIGGAHGTFFVRKRCAEKSHNAVTLYAANCASIAMNAINHNLNRGAQLSFSIFRIEMRNEAGRTLHVSEQNCDFLSLTLQGGSCGKNRLGPILWGHRT
jgi:hypothetical protein